MKECLSVSEAATSRTTTKIAQALPPSVLEYCHYAEGSLGKSIATVYSDVRNLRRFYTLFAEEKSIDLSQATETNL